MASTRAFKQDLPPQGGYAPINFKRIPARTLASGIELIKPQVLRLQYYIFRKNMVFWLRYFPILHPLLLS